jgi:phosphoglycolate phosphatase
MPPTNQFDITSEDESLSIVRSKSKKDSLLVVYNGLKVELTPNFMDATKFKKVLKEIDTFIFDADGVLWLGESGIPGSRQFIDFLLSLDKQVIVLTNNATKSREVYAKKLAKLGYDRSINKETIVNPAAVVADYLSQSGFPENQKKVYLIGGQGVKDELKELGIPYFGTGFDPVDEQLASKGQAFLYDIELEEDHDMVGAVVVGYEKYFNYLKLMKAANYLQDSECLFLGTNEDETCPGPNDRVVIPDAGPLLAAVKVASGREPTVVGKPNSPAFDYIRRRWSIDPRRTMMIGDRTNTDVKFGKDHGMRTMLVLSGCHQVEDVVENQLKNRHDMVPDLYALNLGSLVSTAAKKTQ